MGKIFLLLVFAGIIYTGWNLFSGSDDAPAPVMSGQDAPESDSSRQDSPEAESFRQDSPERVTVDQGETLPGKLFVLAACADWLLVKEWGFCQEGDELPCGRVLKSWSDRLAIVIQDGRESVVRFARLAEFPEWDQVPEPMTGKDPRAPEQSKDGAPGGIVASLFGGNK